MVCGCFRTTVRAGKKEVNGSEYLARLNASLHLDLCVQFTECHKSTRPSHYLMINVIRLITCYLLFASQDTLEMIKMNLITSEAYDILKRDFQYFEDALTDFIDSSEFPHEQRERILQFSHLLKDQVQSYPVLVSKIRNQQANNHQISLNPKFLKCKIDKFFRFQFSKKKTFSKLFFP